MARAFSLQIEGIEDLKKKLGNRAQKYEKGFQRELHAAGLNIQRAAKSRAPRNMGLLAQRIVLVESGLTVDVNVGVSYGAYLEFGTGGKVSIPAGFEDYAAQFRGKSKGTFKDLIMALTDWVHKKGITGTYSVKTQRRTGGKVRVANEDKQAAYAIAISILKKGIRPQPFLIPSFLEEKPKLMKRLKDLIEE